MQMQLKINWRNNSSEDDPKKPHLSQILEYTFDGNIIVESLTLSPNVFSYDLFLSKDKLQNNYNGRIGVRVSSVFKLGTELYKEVGDWVWYGEIKGNLTYKAYATLTTFDVNIKNITIEVVPDVDVESKEFKESVSKNITGNERISSTPFRKIPIPNLTFDQSLPAQPQIDELRKRIKEVEPNINVNYILSKKNNYLDFDCISDAEERLYPTPETIDMSALGAEDFLACGYKIADGVSGNLNEFKGKPICIFGSKTSKGKVFDYVVLPTNTFNYDDGLEPLLSKLPNGFVTKIYFSGEIENISASIFSQVHVDEDDGVEIILNEGLKRISKDAFYGLKAKSIKFPNSLEEIGAYAFYSSWLTHVVIPPNVKKIGDYAFSRSEIRCFYIQQNSDNPLTLGKGVLNYCDSLSYCYLSGNIVFLPPDLFDGKKYLRQCILGEGIKTIPDKLFPPGTVYNVPISAGGPEWKTMK